jgi:hypothetical protein
MDAGLFDASTVKPHRGMAALRGGRKILSATVREKWRAAARVKPLERKSPGTKSSAEKKRPVRGDNRTGQAIWALGVDGRSRRIQPMGRDNRSHIH